MLGPVAGGLITHYFHWSVIFFINVPIGLVGLYLVYRNLPDYREDRTTPLDLPGLALFSSGIALLSYVLEVFGEHRLSTSAVLALLALSALLLAAYGLRATHAVHPLLQLGLFRIRTFRAAVSGSFFTRIGIAGIPFLLPLLYQVGLGYNAIQSGLLMMPQALAAMGLKMAVPAILARFGYRTVLVANTVLLGLLIMLFATIGSATPVGLIVVLSFTYGFFQSLQFTSMNTLV
jgi:MFS family permease